MTSVLGYHQDTKHSFNRFARSLGYLDWAAQPDPFRRYDGAPRIDLPHGTLRPDIPYSALYDGSAPPARLDRASIGELLRCSMGLSAWKQYQANRWALRVNPSSGNLHPTECYVVWDNRVCHYTPREHALEVRATFGLPPGSNHPGAGAAPKACLPEDALVVGLTSVLWREAWKYGERAFRYCQHDVGHAIGAVRFAAALLGWRLTLLDHLADSHVATLLGVDRDDDYVDAEREEAECLLLVSTGRFQPVLDFDGLVDEAKKAAWSGRANVLSRSHVEWPAIDDVARVTRKRDVTAEAQELLPDRGRQSILEETVGARHIILQRRSALGFDASSTLPRDRFMAMLRRLDPGAPPWDAMTWPPHVHLVLFVHRVEGLHPGVYVYVRGGAAVDELRAAMRPDFLWEPVNDPNAPNDPNLFLLLPADVRFSANRLSCDQDIASDGFFSLGMIARLEASLRERGDWFYRRLFWEAGLIGQVLYLEAEAAGGRATGIGCFYDDPVHDVLGLSGMAWQSLYHFSTGVPVDDGRLTSEPGYPGGW